MASTAYPPSSTLAQKTEIYPGTGVYVDQVAWILAKQARGMPGFVGTFIMNSFPLDVLLKSNYKGGKSKHTTVNGQDCREGLDKTIMDAIYKCTMKEYPLTKKQDFGKAVNAKLTNMHYKAKKESPHPSSVCEMSDDSN